MRTIPSAPNLPLVERFVQNLPPRLQEDYFSPIESASCLPIFSDRSAQEISLHPLLSWSVAVPLLLLAGQEESKTDMGGTFVFIACCAITIGIFSKTGWRNEAPK